MYSIIIIKYYMMDRVVITKVDDETSDSSIGSYVPAVTSLIIYFRF